MNHPGHATAPLEVSVIIKALDEAPNIARAIESALAALAATTGEVIVVDAHSDDDTASIAARYPVLVVRLAHRADRACGVGAQVGFRHARGRHLYAMDGDMTLEPGFLPAAIAALQADPGLAGVGGLIEEMHPSMLEQRNRALQAPRALAAGPVDRLYGGGLYRRDAIEDVGYFTHPHLHGFEELELAMRLQARGWRMARLDRIAVRHYGHRLPPLALLALRWRTRYAQGPGEFLRVSIGRPWFGRALAEVATLLVVLAWWLVLGAAIGIASATGMTEAWWAALTILVAPPLAMVTRKRSLRIGLYAVAAWAVFVPGLVAGFVRRPRDPAAPVPVHHLRRPPDATLAGGASGVHPARGPMYVDPA